MRMDLIQPFINSADAVLAQNLRGRIQVDEVSMQEHVYKLQGIGALIWISGEIAGHVLLDVAPSVAATVASSFTGSPVPEDDPTLGEAVLELANQLIGNAVTALNDQGFRFRVHPPSLHTKPEGLPGTEETESLLLCFQTTSGKAYLNVALRYTGNQAETAAAH
jgi:chemotaxis protein CheX